MANRQTERDVLATAVVRSLVAALRTDMGVAWGDIEVKATHPDYDYDSRPLADGSREKRDLTVAPFIGIHEVSHSSGPWSFPNEDTREAREFILSILLLAANHIDISELHSTVQSVLQGLSNGRGAFPLLDPADDTAVGEDGILRDVIDGGLFGPGDDVERAGTGLIGHAQFQNLKHRARVAVRVEVYKRAGSRVA